MTNRGRPPTITSSGKKAKKEDRFQPWNRALAVPDLLQQREMLTEALKTGLTLVMTNHVYEFDGVIRRQSEGGPIGLELTGNVAQVFMIWWDRSFADRMYVLGLEETLCKRYVDDVNHALRELPLGTRYIHGVLSVVEAEVEEDRKISGDKRTMEMVKQIGNEIHPSIQLEIDYPSNYEDNKMPILDLKAWVETKDGSTRIVHQHYAKDVSSNAVVHAKSALAWSAKRSILTQEVLRVLLNCSPDLRWEERAQHASVMVLRMQYSGYTRKFRAEVVESALKAYDIILTQVREGVRPLYRPYEWNREERDREKREKRLGWYKKGGYDSVIFVPSSPGSELQRRYQQEIDHQGIRIRAVECAGRTLKGALQRSNPFRGASCSRESCFVCDSGGRGSCEKEGVRYQIECLGCDEEEKKSIYVGETSRNTYTRGLEHLSELNGRVPQSVLWRHCSEKHGGNMVDFRMGVTGQYRNDAMMRQIAEAVRINGSDDGELINNKSEWNYLTFPRVRVDDGTDD